MKNNLVLFGIIISILMLLLIFSSLKKEKIPIKYALVWLFAILVFLITCIAPKFMKYVSNFFGFDLVSNMIFTIIIIILLYLTFILTIIISGQNKKITSLIQEVSILNSKIGEKDVK